MYMHVRTYVYVYMYMYVLHQGSMYTALHLYYWVNVIVYYTASACMQAKP